MNARSEPISLPGAGGRTLPARLEYPDQKPVAYAVFAHFFNSSRSSAVAGRVTHALTSCGVAVLSLDLGDTSLFVGAPSDNGSPMAADLIAAASFLRTSHEAPRLLVGHSVAGAAMLVAASSITEAAGVATIGAPSDLDKVRLAAAPADIRALSGEAVVSAAAHLDRALLVCHSPADPLVPIEHAEQIFQAAHHPKSLVALEGADHLVSQEHQANNLAALLSLWISQHLPPSVSDGLAQQAGAAVIVRETGTGRLSNEIAISKHRMLSDEPVSGGGNDQGPSPYEFLLAGLGACTSMTLRLYAERKGWPLERVTVRLEHQRTHSDDLATFETKEGKIDRINRVITLEGPLDADHKRRLLQIAEKCPVHRTLHAGLWIVSRLEEQ